MDITSRLSNHFQTRSPSGAFLYAAILAILIGVIDYLTGYEVTFFPFYSFPILLLVWRGETRGAIGIAVLSAVVWWAADTASGHVYSQEWLRIWDSVVRLMFFCLVVVSGTMLKSRGDASRQQIELLERSHKLEEQIIGISEREQQRLGHDLHDGLCQYLASLVFVSDSLKENLKANAPQFADSAGELSRLLRQGVLRARDIARGLSPVDRDEGGLESALSDLASSTSRLVGIYCSFVAEGHVDSLSDQEAVDVFRIAQEALANAVKHGLARSVVIALDVNDADFALRISDDGVGFDPARLARGGMGLNIMRYRARRLGGGLEIFSNHPSGTVISCTVQRVGVSNPATLETPS